jgi:hypothetical protein
LWPDLTLLERTMGASMRYCFILALVAVAFSFALSSVRAKIRVAQATTIAGSHGVVGTNPDDSTYSGTVVISNISDNQYRFDCRERSELYRHWRLAGTSISVDWGQDAP